MGKTITVTSSYETYYETEITLPEGRSKDEIVNIIHKWSDIWIEFKDGETWHAGEQNYDAWTIDDGKYPFKLMAQDEDGEEFYEGAW